MQGPAEHVEVPLAKAHMCWTEANIHGLYKRLGQEESITSPLDKSIQLEFILSLATNLLSPRILFLSYIVYLLSMWRMQL